MASSLSVRRVLLFHEIHLFSMYLYKIKKEFVSRIG